MNRKVIRRAFIRNRNVRLYLKILLSFFYHLKKNLLTPYFCKVGHSVKYLKYNNIHTFNSAEKNSYTFRLASSILVLIMI